MKNNCPKKESERFPMINFFELKDEDLIVLNPYDFNAAINRLKNLTIEDVKDDLRHFQKKEFEFRNYEEENSFNIDKIRFVTSTKNENDSDFILLKDLTDYIIPEKMASKDKEDKSNKDNPEKRISLDIKSQEGGKKEILIKCFVNPKKISENIISNFINKSEFKKSAEDVRARFEQSLKELDEKNEGFRFSMKIEMNSLVKIYHNKKKDTFFFDLQSPPIFRTNFLISENSNQKNGPKDENSIFPFRNFYDEFQNLKYRHFIIMIEKQNTMETPENENDLNFDTNEELYNSLENLFKNRSGGTDKKKFQEKDIVLKNEEKEMKNLTYFFNYDSEDKQDIKRKLKDLNFLIKNEKQKNSKKNGNNSDSEKEGEKGEGEEEKEEKEEEKEKYNDKEVIKLFYQVVALVSECILSYYNGVKLLSNLLIDNKYKEDIFEKCTNETFPIFFNLTLTKILDKYQNSFEEKSLKELEDEMKSAFEALYAQYESEGLDEILKPSKNEILMRVQRCVITPTYILFTPYVLDQGNRILRQFKNPNYSMLCTFKMDSLEEARWNNSLLIEYIKFIMSRGFYIGVKKFKFFNYSQSQFRNMSCWLLTDPEKIITKLGDFSKIKALSKYAARISQTLTTTIKTIYIPKDKIKYIPDVKSKDKKYTFSDGVGKMSVSLSEQISKKLKLDYIPSCFQGRFLGCKGVWTTMWDDKSGNIYCRDSQVKFNVEPKEKYNYFELCDYSRYIQSYLNRQVILLLSSLGIKDQNFAKKLEEYKSKLNDQKFVLSLVHYPEWNQILKTMNSCGISRTNDRLLRSIIESNLDILYNDIKKKARIYVDESAYVIGIMDEYGVLEYGEAFLHIKRDNLDLILDKKCAVAKCPCLHPGDIRVLRFKKYNKNDESTKKYEVFNKYENVVIFPSKGKRPHPDECSGSDLDGDNYFIFYDNDLVPSKTVEPMNYSFETNEKKKESDFTINDVITYFAEYTNLNSLGLIGDAHLALSDKDGANSSMCIKLAEKFSKAVDAPKTGEKVILDKEEQPDKFPHFMGKNKNKSYISKNILGQLYDKANEYISKRIKRKSINGLFYDEDIKLKNWENYAFLALIYYRDYFTDLVNLLKKNEIIGESVLLTGNNIDNENSLLSKKRHNYDLREKVGIDMHEFFIDNKNNFYEAIEQIFLNKNNKNQNQTKEKNSLDKKDLINNNLYFMNNLNLFASSCYMITYNIIEDVINKKIENKSSIEYFCKKFANTINDNLIMNNDFEELNEISEYEAENLGFDYYDSNENSYELLYEKINNENKYIKETIEKKKNDMNNFVNELKTYKIPKQPDEENQYRILSFPWCISGQILSNIKFIKMNFDNY